MKRSQGKQVGATEVGLRSLPGDVALRAKAPTNLGRVLHRWRINEALTLRGAAKAIGTSAATLMRLEHGYNPDAETLVKLLVWLMKGAG